MLILKLMGADRDLEWQMAGPDLQVCNPRRPHNNEVFAEATRILRRIAGPGGSPRREPALVNESRTDTVGAALGRGSELDLGHVPVPLDVDCDFWSNRLRALDVRSWRCGRDGPDVKASSSRSPMRSTRRDRPAHEDLMA
ncbi:hypothetical protein [Nocardioides taihuensis]|uniref:Uncharacterized protein n=1 Tax=Nocardioides taihuensis TaxID=1835606 RepID=A0ABW0BLC0_9ACTN